MAHDSEAVHDGSDPDCTVCASVREIQAGGMLPDGTMSKEEQAGAVQSALSQLPPELRQVVESGRGAAGIRETLNFYQEVLSGTSGDAPRPGDPRVQLAMAVLQMNSDNVLPGLKRASYEVITAALFMRPAMESSDGWQ